jgi:hypothetical protein
MAADLIVLGYVDFCCILFQISLVLSSGGFRYKGDGK